MLQRSVFIGLCAISAAVLVWTEAKAQFFNGWGWFCCSEVTGYVDLSKVPNPVADPSIVTVTGLLNTIEVICYNPKNHEVLPGNAGTREVATASVIASENVTNRQRALARVPIRLGADELAAAETSAACVNAQWIAIQGSAAPKAMTLTMETFLCIPESNKDKINSPDGDPCVCDNPAGCGSVPPGGLTIEATPRDTVHLQCSLDPVRRNLDPNVAEPPYLAPLHNQVITCIEP